MKLSDKEIAQLLSNLEIKKFETHDEQEVAGYAEVMETVFAHFDAIERTENHINQLYRDLFIHSEKDERRRGNGFLFRRLVAINMGEMGYMWKTVKPLNQPQHQH